MKAGLLFTAGVVAAAAHPRRHQHAAKRQDVDVEMATVVNTVTTVEANAIVYVDGNGSPVSTSYGAPEPTPAELPVISAVIPTSSSEAPVVSSSVSTPSPAPSPNSALKAAAAPDTAASAGASVDTVYTLAYSPYNSDGTCKNQQQVNNDFNVISGYGLVRIYGTDCNQLTTVLNAARAKGMKLFAGVYDVNKVNAEVQLIINAAHGDWSSFDTVSIGNEGVNSGAYSVSQVVQAVATARNLLMAAGYRGNVVTVDTFVAIIANPALCQVSDYSAANCHAFFDGGVTADQAGQFVLNQAQRVSQACPGKRTVITESGWPSAGNTNGKAVPSPQNQVTAINSIKAAFKNRMVIFSAFNDRWKKDNQYTFGAEHYWGIYGDSRA